MHQCGHEGCSRSFKRREHLSRHRLNHQPRKIHQCHVCDKDFVRLDLLQRHMRRHDNGMVYRRTGGYTTSGSPKSTRSGRESVQINAMEIDPADEATDKTDVANSSSMASVGDRDSHRGDLSGVPAELNSSTSVETLDVEHLTFFDGSNDGAGLNQDLDWLFGATPWDMSTAEWTTAPESKASQSSMTSLAPEEEPLRNNMVPREKVLSALTSLPIEVLESAFFEPVNLEQFMLRYWEDYNTHFSLFHKPTFSVRSAPPLLLVALLTLGATLSPNDEHYRVAEEIHQNLRWLIFTSPEFQAPAPLWIIQALLIVQSYEKMFSTRRQHEMAHIFHYSVITLMRRGSCYSLDMEGDGDTSSIERTWHRWAETEMSYRAAYFAFVMDSQHTSLFGHTAALSITDIQLPLPCSEALWNAQNAAAWNSERSRAPSTPRFLSALRALLSHHPIPHTYSPFARFVLLHGLFCLTRHMIERDQTASCIGMLDQNPLGTDTGPCSTPELDNWRDRLDRAIDTWSFSLLSQEPSLCLEAARPLQRIAHVSIRISLIDFHILAGAPTLATGVRAKRDSAQFSRAYKRISEWVRHNKAKKTLKHCLLLIQETMFTRTRYAATEDNIVLRPWILYHMTLVLWAYGAITDRAGRPRDQKCSVGSHHWTAEEYLSHMLNSLMGEGELSQIQGTSRTDGLVAAVSAALTNCRWKLLEEAKETLNRLPTQAAILRSMTPGNVSEAPSQRQS
ncbi:fungal-specific transcription factor domain-containing protein [Xylariaceae sp. FL0016]|nr:fungal-specific transcription factor domain-containing protein [Xylariaceae sp. FL0016]